MRAAHIAQSHYSQAHKHWHCPGMGSHEQRYVQPATVVLLGGDRVRIPCKHCRPRPGEQPFSRDFKGWREVNGQAAEMSSEALPNQFPVGMSPQDFLDNCNSAGDLLRHYMSAHPEIVYQVG